MHVGTISYLWLGSSAVKSKFERDGIMLRLKDTPLGIKAQRIVAFYTKVEEYPTSNLEEDKRKSKQESRNRVWKSVILIALYAAFITGVLGFEVRSGLSVTIVCISIFVLSIPTFIFLSEE